jgi:hypothetical protein
LSESGLRENGVNPQTIANYFAIIGRIVKYHDNESNGTHRPDTPGQREPRKAQ